MAIRRAGSGPTTKDNNNNMLPVKSDELGPTPFQHELFHVEKQVEHDGVEMGVLENGIPY